MTRMLEAVNQKRARISHMEGPDAISVHCLYLSRLSQASPPGGSG